MRNEHEAARQTLSHHPIDWTSIDWKKVNKKVRNLRRRIYKATREKRWRTLRNLQHLLMCSFSVKVLAIKKVTQINEGKKTAGIDGMVVNSTEEREKLFQECESYKTWKPLPVQRVYIQKPNGGKRPLGIPTIKDRVHQTIVKEALEPEWETRFEAHSYGFRPGRCTQDAIGDIYVALNNGATGRHQWILDADISKAFDTINHEYILTQLRNFPAKGLIQKWLKAGYLEIGQLHDTEMGTPQGGTISPLLANIALDGLQAHLGKGYRYVRYADDFVIMAKTKQAIEDIQPKVEAWLLERGLRLNNEKTHILHREQGFNFLGFHIRMYGKKLIIQPQKGKVLKLLRQISDWLKNNKQLDAEKVVTYLNPILRGWTHYYRFVCSKSTFSNINHTIYWKLWRWAKRRHPHKPVVWILNTYFETHPYGSGRSFKGLVNIARDIPIIRHIKVKGTASPDDPELQQYWEDRIKKTSRYTFARGSKLYLIAEEQRWKCRECGQPLKNGEEFHIHHRTPTSHGGTDDMENLDILHKACHHLRHARSRKEHRVRAA